jgi:wyosine [tRNA(Phe)-imidazoG37] synthetase (radical SAM superfamily)
MVDRQQYNLKVEQRIQRSIRCWFSFGVTAGFIDRRDRQDEWPIKEVNAMRSVYGVKSGESGCGLGVDPICRGPKVCNFNCSYCRLGKGGMKVSKRSKFVAEQDLANDFLEHITDMEIDHVTFRGTGEPLLAENLGDIVGALRKLTDKKMSVVTNCTLLNEEGALAEILKFDIIVAKIDAATEMTFQKVNRPCREIHLEDVISGAKRARRTFKGDFNVKTTLVGQNIGEVNEIAATIKGLDPKFVYIETPNMPNTGRPLTKKDHEAIEKAFRGMNPVFEESG